MLGRKRSVPTDSNSTKYRKALENKDIPPLTLDNKWHQLFSSIKPTPRIERLAKQLNDLLKQQGKLYNDMQGIRNLKKKLMNTVMSDMGAASSGNTDDLMERKMEERSRLIEECSDKMYSYKGEYDRMPEQIREVNYQLMMETMELCYRKIRENSMEIDEIDEWVTRTRSELKKQLVIKEEDIAINHKLYSFMHDIFGSRVMEIFDVEYDPKEKIVSSKKR